MAITIALALQKGGVGKTTTTAALAYAALADEVMARWPVQEEVRCVAS